MRKNKYRRQGIYNYDKKQWQSYYYNLEGKLVIDRYKGFKNLTGKEQYNLIREKLKKNKVSKEDDFYTKKESLYQYSAFNKKVANQKDVDKLLKKKTLTKLEKTKLYNLSQDSNYKVKKVKKRTRGRLKEEIIEKFERELYGAFFLYSSKYQGFYISPLLYNEIRPEIAQTFEKYDPDRVHVEFSDLSGNVNYVDLISSLEEFEQALTAIVVGAGHDNFYEKGYFNFKITLIDR